MQNAHKLAVYGEARDLAVAIYRLTADFPPSERFAMVQQMRRAAISVGSNIAEGCGRKGSRALLPFLHYAIGSLNELAFQLEIAQALGHCASDQTQYVLVNLVRTRRMLIRLAVVVAKRSANTTTAVTQHPRPTTHYPR
jgi:four helix bundle protein